MKKQELIKFLANRDGLVCGICGQSLEEEWKALNLWWSNVHERKVKRKHANIDIDHTIPYSVVKGFRWGDLNNLRLTHKTCNNKKGSKLDVQSTN